jgi:hypothetical protein
MIPEQRVQDNLNSISLVTRRGFPHPGLGVLKSSGGGVYCLQHSYNATTFHCQTGNGINSSLVSPIRQAVCKALSHEGCSRIGCPLRYHRWYRGSGYDLHNESCGHSGFASNVRHGGLIQRFLQADI